MLRFLIAWVVLFFVVAAVTSAIAGLGTVEIVAVAVVTGAFAILIARHKRA
jgi:hypothetical protein